MAFTKKTKLDKALEDRIREIVVEQLGMSRSHLAGKAWAKKELGIITKLFEEADEHYYGVLVQRITNVMQVTDALEEWAGKCHKITRGYPTMYALPNYETPNMDLGDPCLDHMEAENHNEYWTKHDKTVLRKTVQKVVRNLSNQLGRTKRAIEMRIEMLHHEDDLWER